MADTRIRLLNGRMAKLLAEMGGKAYVAWNNDMFEFMTLKVLATCSASVGTNYK